MTRIYSLLAALLLAAPLLAGCDDAGVEPIDGGDIASTLAADDDFDTLTQALAEAAAVRSALAGPGPYTLFAPTDDAFTYVGASTQTALFAPANRPLLERILRYHIVPSRLTPADLTDGAALTTLDGTTLHVRREDELIFVDDAEVDVEDLIDADNGVIFPVNDVLRSNLDIASRLLLVPIADDFVRYATRTGALGALDENAEFTILAPIDDAFARLGSATLSLLDRTTNADVLDRLIDFHVIPGRVDLATLESGTELETLDGAVVTFTRDGGRFLLDGRNVVATPAETANGLIYLLDTVLLDDLTLDERLRISPTLGTFEYEVRQRPDLLARLAGSDEYTVFAFTNTGYNTLPLQVREALNTPANAALLDRLVRYHVVPGRFPSDALVDGQELVTIDGLPLKVQRIGSELFIGERKVEERDIPASNGLLYHLSGVMLPLSDLVDSAILRGFTVHVQALRSLGLEARFRQPGAQTLFAFPNETYTGTNPPLLDHPDLRDIILYHAADVAVGPPEHNATFNPLEGPTRTVVLAPSAVYFLDGVTEIFYYGPATNGSFYSALDPTTPSAPLVPLTR